MKTSLLELNRLSKCDQCRDGENVSWKVERTHGNSLAEIITTINKCGQCDGTTCYGSLKKHMRAVLIL